MSRPELTSKSATDNDTGKNIDAPSLTESDENVFTVLLFASASAYCDDHESLTFAAPATLAALADELESRFPGFARKVLRSSNVTINLDYVDVDMGALVDGMTSAAAGTDGVGGIVGGGADEKRIGEDVVIERGDEVGIVPPVSAG